MKKGEIQLGNTWKTFTFEVPLDVSYKGKWGYEEVDGRAYRKFRNIRWYTNLEVKNKCKPVELTESYNPFKHPQYINTEAIEVSRVKDIPKDYKGVMGVPITFFDVFNPNQFEILGMSGTYPTFKTLNVDSKMPWYMNNGILKQPYHRIFIKRR